MKIGILQTGHVPKELENKYPNYSQQFITMLHGNGFEFINYDILNDELPQSPSMADGWLITGSKYSAYEDHSWIKPLENFIKNSYDNNIPMVGICFGHQIIAKALGGKVEKWKNGWSVGATEYKLINSDKILCQNAMHQDQVTVIPDGATVIATSSFCKYAAMSYGKKALTWQCHPEFSSEFMKDLIISRQDILPVEIAKNALESLKKPLTTDYIIQEIVDFYNSN